MRTAATLTTTIFAFLLTTGTSLSAQHDRHASMAEHLTITDETATTELVITFGPLNLPANASHHEVEQIPLERGHLPFTGWLHGFKVEMVTADGDPIPSAVVHHVNLLDMDRRAVLMPIAQRILAAGRETPPLSLPKTHGYPVEEGGTIGLFTGFHNPTDESYPEAYLKLSLTYTKAPAEREPVSVYSIWFDAKLEPGQGTDFDLPPGAFDKWQEFTPAISGKLLALGGHLHDYGTRLVLEDRTDGTVLFDVEPVKDSTGHVERIPTKLYLGQPLELVAGHSYRITAYYDNPTGAAISDGGMGQIGGVFVPNPNETWPALDEDDPLFKADLMGLESGHGGMTPSEHNEHQHR